MHLNKEVTFVDLGVWVGLCSMWGAVIGCNKTLALEANPRSFKPLQKRIITNKEQKDVVS
tara:strand:+ start:508 stop:687 length:180 start_codon:yes stop_codon:yes gene_type:complete